MNIFFIQALLYPSMFSPWVALATDQFSKWDRKTNKTKLAWSCSLLCYWKMFMAVPGIWVLLHSIGRETSLFTVTLLVLSMVWRELSARIWHLQALGHTSSLWEERRVGNKTCWSPFLWSALAKAFPIMSKRIRNGSAGMMPGCDNSPLHSSPHFLNSSLRANMSLS